MFIRQPHVVNHNLVVRLESLDNPARLPVPEHHITRSRPGRDVLAIRRESKLTSVPRNGVTREPLLLVLPKVAIRGVHEDLIVERLARDKLVCKLAGCWTLDSPLGCLATDGIECMYGSAMYLITTGMS